MSGNHEMTDIAIRLWRRVEKTGHGGCWVWTGAKHEFGYGLIGKGRRGTGLVRTHRLAYQLKHGPIPKGMCVLHKCDNPPCVNPAHLFLGTVGDNHADMIKKGRHHNPPYKAGSDNGNSKLTEKIVLAIRGARGISLKDMAKKYGVSVNTISRVIYRESWKHVK